MSLGMLSVAIAVITSAAIVFVVVFFTCQVRSAPIVDEPQFRYEFEYDYRHGKWLKFKNAGLVKDADGPSSDFQFEQYGPELDAFYIRGFVNAENDVHAKVMVDLMGDNHVDDRYNGK